ncbi:hypothetical protein INR49_025794 [Caranx melampygus]|nr:hypothetical protein INR49_025794 [Caranx melampygus]
MSDHTDLQNKGMCGSEAAVLDQGMKLLGEDECVWTEGVPAERRVLQVSHALYFTQVSTLQCFTHFFNTKENKTQHFIQQYVM